MAQKKFKTMESRLSDMFFMYIAKRDKEQVVEEERSGLVGKYNAGR